MGLTTLAPENLAQEAEIQRQIDLCVVTRSDFVFKAGAGAGKTHSLITTLKNLLKVQGRILECQNKNIICITYTNAATDEIRKRLGDSDIIKVSTIHKRMWNIIQLQQSAMLLIHKDKINNEIITIQQEINSNTQKFYLFTNLSPENKCKFVDYMLANKKDFYRLKKGNAGPLKERFKGSLAGLGYVLKNVENFKSTVSKVIKEKQLTNCLISMENGEDKFKKVRYDANYNSDQLHNMLISHDTLLEYARKLVEQYSLFRDIIIDSYPYFFIDEYQDTSDNVVIITSILSAYAKEKNKKFIVGYFGDEMQNIYDDGVGSDLDTIHPELVDVIKVFNRRSHSEIIDISNKLRNDEVIQKSIYTDNTGGSFSFKTTMSPLSDEPQLQINKFISDFKEKCNLTDDEQIDCLILTNLTLAKLAEFHDVYVSLEGFFFHSDAASKIISSDLDKLDDCVRVIFRIINLHLTVKNSVKLKLIDILPKSLNGDITSNEASTYLSNLASVYSNDTGNQSLLFIIKKAFHLYNSNQVDPIFKKRIEELLPEYPYEYSTQGFIDFLSEKLPTLGSFKEDEKIEKINKALNVSLQQYINWHEHLIGIKNKKIRFHTYHSTKGLEYKNVVIIMQNRFARDENYFPNFFKKTNDDLSQKKRNLLYVACSRAITNLTILYADDISSFEEEISYYFGKPEIL
ncbi:MAG: DNA helicase-2/ATP-dependent DNA helicase PcrA [Arcobacteraceae bacterium]|jgi:DNA helicase-2/ATP-dependent DNA helicase PcrA